jgi:hypothetical protein
MDDRVHCNTCQNLQHVTCSATKLRVMDDLPRRCLHYLPTKSDPDQTPGAVRFAWIARDRARAQQPEPIPAKRKETHR